MKILIYSDLHCCYTTSLLPIYCEGSKYTTRLQMVIDTGKWIAEMADKFNVDTIINGGDTFDSNIVRSEEISAISEFFSYFPDDIRHIIIVGNHEMLNDNFNFANAFKNTSCVEVYDKPRKLDDTISVIPYMKADKINPELLSSISNEFLISHIDIKGSCLRDDYILDEGVDPDLIAEYFKFTANGHLHTAEKLSTMKNTVYNIGSVSSVSFVDSNSYIPSICIYDTDTGELKRIPNPNAILFRKMNISTVDDLITRLSKFDKRYRYVVRVTCPYNIREDIRSIVSRTDNIVSYRVVANIGRSKFSGSSSVIAKLNSNRDMKVEFRRYLENNPEVMNYPTEEYRKVIDEI